LTVYCQAVTEETAERTPATEAIDSVLAAARALGVELDAAEAEAWIASMSSEASGSLVVDVDAGVYGHRVTMADMDDAGVGRFRRMASIVGFEDRPPEVLTALALAGSAAQGRVHRFPADCDFFERIHIRADTREAACETLATIMRDKATSTLAGPGFRLHEVKFGTWPADVTVGDQAVRAGSPVSWTATDLERGEIGHVSAGGAQASLTWADAARQPGWCKLDWVIADPERGGLANASNSLDVTWEAPDGTVTPLDGFLDPYFQEVYLESDSIPLFSRLVKQMGADSVADYVGILEHEVHKYTVDEPNHGKAARRLYNIFRLTGRYAEAAYIRELFDEPVGALYQLAALLRTLDDAADSPDSFGADALVHEVDSLIMSAIGALEGPSEAQMVARLLRVRDAVATSAAEASYETDLEAARTDAMRAVDEFFSRALRAVPGIATYLDEVAAMSD
jgi:hypothetical protein